MVIPVVPPHSTLYLPGGCVLSTSIHFLMLVWSQLDPGSGGGWREGMSSHWGWGRGCLESLGPLISQTTYTETKAVFSLLLDSASRRSPLPVGGGVLGQGRGGLCHPVLWRTVCGEVREFVAVFGKGLHAPHGMPLKWCRPFLWGQPGMGRQQLSLGSHSGPSLGTFRPSPLAQLLGSQWAHLPHSGCVILAWHCLSGPVSSTGSWALTPQREASLSGSPGHEQVQTVCVWSR